MVNIIKTVTVHALKIILTEVQISIYNGIPSFQIVGMVNKSVNEAVIRIRAVINALGLDLPAKKVIVNFSPTDVIKDGNYYDLPIIIGILSELNVIKNIDLSKFLIIGELSLDCKIKHVNIALITAIYAMQNNYALICPSANGSIAALSGLKNIVAPEDLVQLIAHLNESDENKKIKMQNPPIIRTKTYYDQDFSMLKGQYELKRALEIAAAGGHSVFMKGPPGCGKTFSVECFQSIMPDLSLEEIIEICLIKSIGSKERENHFEQNLEENMIEVKRPFRNPHHSASMASIVGGGRMIEPGEVTLAHNGVLFLDELPEFSPAVLDALREPIEDKIINISRAERSAIYPANFQLIVALNPCKCGYFGDRNKECSRAPSCTISYQNRISGPFLDRIDLFVNINDKSAADDASSNEKYTNSALIKERVNIARKIQSKRYANLKYKTNSSAKGDKDFLELILIKDEANNFLKELLNLQKINYRGFKNILGVARTAADLEEREYIEKSDILEALYFRKK